MVGMNDNPHCRLRSIFPTGFDHFAAGGAGAAPRMPAYVEPLLPPLLEGLEDRRMSLPAPRPQLPASEFCCRPEPH